MNTTHACEHVISAKQFNREQLDRLFQEAGRMPMYRRLLERPLNGKIMASLFFEPSTRTRFSFESAMMRLGGQVISTENAREFSSAIKGETLEDTIRVVSQYADVIVLRHFEQGAARRAASVSEIPVINAGDGAGEHPTQALLDLYTIQTELGTIDGTHIVMIGDLTYGRTVHSLSMLLTNYRDIRVTYVSPPQTQIPAHVREEIAAKGIRVVETDDLVKAVQDADVLYQTRVQKERFPSLEVYEEVKGKYVIDPHMMEHLQQHAIIMHPLPRAGEILPEVDQDPRAAYFRQAKNGVDVRMALLLKCCL
ncbi:aspartate carbamoyltransferase [Fodinisporobacter ferrooxydans]|uniref:Aspartate carbamoyltransferase n=1 Tax=Fodinisporobacter ferrooxydans TaxID=2901836 RepID=A0ABY4CIW3_9BACL|nr:aspartate carbamoyltransferase [Alicyclobacillaceae bacterium MYW30-H2]